MVKLEKIKKFNKQNKNGIILVYVLAFTLLITALILTIHYKVENFMDIFAERVDFIEMENYANLGFSIGKKLLEIDDNSYDWYGENWGQDIEIDTEKYLLKVKIYDEDGKININKIIGEKGRINTLLLDILKRLFTILKCSDSMVDCLLDWIDEDELPRSSGAESTFYRMNGYSYVPPNRPLYSIGEIALIKGFDKSIVYGKNEENEEETDENNEEEIKKGIINFLSTISDDKININTCEGEILSAMGYDDANVDFIMSERNRGPLSENFLLNINKETTLKNNRIIKYKSSNFSIDVSVESKESQKKTHIIFFVYKDKQNKATLLRKEKIWES